MDRDDPIDCSVDWDACAVSVGQHLHFPRTKSTLARPFFFVAVPPEAVFDFSVFFFSRLFPVLCPIGSVFRCDYARILRLEIGECDNNCSNDLKEKRDCWYAVF